MRKFKGLLMTSLVLIIMLTGCTSKNTAEPSTSQTSSTSTDEQKQDDSSQNLDPVELTWYQNMGTKMKDEKLVIDELNKYLKEKINTTVNLVVMTNDDFTTKIPLIMSTGQPYDVVFTAGWVNQYLPNVAKGAFAPMNELLDEYGKETKDFIPKAMWDAVSVKGQIYGVPSYKEVGHQYGLFINTDIADKYGYDLTKVKKIEDLEPYFKDLKQKDPSIIPFTGLTADMILGAEHLTGDWDLPAVAKVDTTNTYASQSAEVFNQYATPEYAAFTELQHQWWVAGYLPKDTVKYNEEGKITADDKAGKIFAWPIGYAPGYETTYATQVGHGVTYIPLANPIFETSDVFGGLQAISANSKHKDRAMMLLNLVNTDKYVGTLLRHGIEGTHYVMKGDQLDRSAVAGIDAKNHPYDYTFGWQWGTVFNQTWDVSYPANIVDIFKKFNDASIPTSHLGFNFDATPVQTEIAALQNVVKEFKKPLDYGMVDPKTYLPKFIDKLKANGADKLTAEVQKQVEAWKATQK
ncbi:ABC transporter substrate-binding protein [Paenibacillus sp. FSL R10-2734]|uniref:ABC transporter substrate-binding protein n=1 Tax=Paenibacillus sp. FSL R10-2734 TaxID=2954691 RepID=UPI0030DAD088